MAQVNNNRTTQINNKHTNMKNKYYYFFENEQGLWLKDGSRTETTNNPNEASKLKDKFEAELFCSGLEEFKVTEHEFV